MFARKEDIAHALQQVAANFAEIMKDGGETRITGLNVRFDRNGAVYAKVRQERSLYLHPNQFSDE